MDYTVNRQHKDRLFRFLFGESKENALSLYNALNHSSYTKAEQLEFTTIGDALYMGMKNDLSFLFEMELSVYEHQSTLNPNMPLRGLLYLPRLFEAYVTKQRVSIYDSALLRLPTPHYVVFYNGKEKAPETWEMRLSDAFDHPGGCVELVVTVYNINAGNNRELMEQCRPLGEYAELISLIRQNQAAGMEIGSAVNSAVDACINRGILADVLIKHKAEVVGMLLTEYNEAETMELIRESAERRGMEKGILKSIRSMMETLKLTSAQAMDVLSIPASEQPQYLAKL